MRDAYQGVAKCQRDNSNTNSLTLRQLRSTTNRQSDTMNRQMDVSYAQQVYLAVTL